MLELIRNAVLSGLPLGPIEDPDRVWVSTDMDGERRFHAEPDCLAQTRRGGVAKQGHPGGWAAVAQAPGPGAVCSCGDGASDGEVVRYARLVTKVTIFDTLLGDSEATFEDIAVAAVYVADIVTSQQRGVPGAHRALVEACHARLRTLAGAARGRLRPTWTPPSPPVGKVTIVGLTGLWDTTLAADVMRHGVQISIDGDKTLLVRQSTEELTWLDHPLPAVPDATLLDVAVRLWEPTGTGPLSSPTAALETAAHLS